LSQCDFSSSSREKEKGGGIFCLHGVVGAQPRLLSLCFVLFVYSVRELDFLAAGV
jgi:hypothetical protein